ncbi:MAG: 2-oxo acid dehydrogenase subunit E2 [Phycisphaerales bacterium]|nr:2-oxo acid dehydrogenase subunit E2 [Phycisphaerales bacterium]
MSIKLTMPRLSDTMEAGTIVRWNVKVGDRVQSGSAVADVETDKATMEMQVFDDGVVACLVVPEGRQVPIGTLIAIIAEEGEDPQQVAASNAAAGVSSAGGGASLRSPAPEATRAPTAEESSARCSPLARKLADHYRIDIATLKGSGPGGRVIKRDILAAAGVESTEDMPLGDTGSAAVLGSAAGTEGITEIPSRSLAAITPGAIVPIVALPQPTIVVPGREIALSGMRQTIARRLVESKTTIPHYQVSMRFAMDAVLELRVMLNGQLEPQGVKLSVNDFIVRACAIAMQTHPYFNASWAGDRIVIHGAVNIGVAISLPAQRGGGLVVATIHSADQKGLRQISLDTKALAEKARTKGLGIEDMSDATFTISNLGMFGVDNFTAIINPPNSAILACGAAVEQPVVRNHQLVVGHEMLATLSLDHRVIDGAMAAEFLQTVRHNIENPATLLV